MNEPVTHTFTRVFLAVILGYTTVSPFPTQVVFLLYFSDWKKMCEEQDTYLCSSSLLPDLQLSLKREILTLILCS